MLPRFVRNTIFRIRYGFQGVPCAIQEYPIRLDESLRGWNIEAEAAAHDILKGCLKPGDVFIDVGATFGLYTLYAAKLVGAEGHVFAFEPVPSNLKLLRRNLTLNNVEQQVTIAPQALSNSQASHLTFYLPPEDIAVTASLRSAHSKLNTITVANGRLDNYWKTVNLPIRLIKIDVGGAELDVLRGAEAILRHWRPLLLIEVHGYALPTFDTSVAQLRHFLAALNYQEHRLPGDQFQGDEYFQAIYRPGSAKQLVGQLSAQAQPQQQIYQHPATPLGIQPDVQYAAPVTPQPMVNALQPVLNTPSETPQLVPDISYPTLHSMVQFYTSQTVAVTGGLGLIGSFLCEELLNIGANVVLIDDESRGNWTYSGHIRDLVEYRKGSLEDPKFAIASLSGCDYVFHLASRLYGSNQTATFETFRLNDLINTNVLDAIAYHQPKQALVVSSSCVYSDNSPSPISDCLPTVEEPEVRNWGDGWAKRFLEQKAFIYQKETQIPITIVRPFNVYGERYHWAGDDSQALPMLTKRVLDGEIPLLVWGSGNQRRNYIHALDCARAMMRLVENGYAERPINLGREETVSVKELVLRLANIAGVEVQIMCDRDKPEGRFIKSADSKLLSAALGDDFTWQIDLQSGLAKMVDWYHITFQKPSSKSASAPRGARLETPTRL